MLRRRLTIPAAIIVLALCLALAGIGYWAGHTIIASFSNQLVEHYVNDIAETVGTEMERSQRVLSRVTADITRYDIPLDDPAAVRRELYAVLTDEPNIDRLFFANAAGGMVGATRLADGTLVFFMTDGFRPGVLRRYDAAPDGQLETLRSSSTPFDARQAPWYQPARAAHGWYLTAPYRGPGAFGLRVSLAAPIFGVDGRFAGVLGTDRLLANIATDIQPTHVVGRQERSFIIDSAGRLIASSGGVMSVVKGPDGSEHRVLAADAADPVVRGTARYLQLRPDLLSSLHGDRERTYAFNASGLGETYAAVMSFPSFGGANWTLVSAVPASDFLAPMRYALTFSIVMSVLVVTVALALGNRIAALTLRPLTALTETARAITRGEWPDLPDVQRNDEIGLLARAFKGMIASLKDTQNGLRRSEENYRSIVENALEGIIRISHDGRVIAANPALARMLGYASPDEMIAARTVEAELVRANVRAREAKLSTLPSPDAVTGYETELHGKEGRSIWVLLSSRLVRDASGEPIYTETFITDLTERKRADQERQDHIWFLESMETINRAIQGTNDLEQMTRDALSAVLSIFACDRAWLVYPCDPEAPSWRAVMEQTRPDYPGVFALGIDLPIDAEVANVFETAGASSGAVQFGSEADCPVPAQLAERFGIQSFIAMAVYPKVEKPYLFGLYQCSSPRIWTAWEERLFQEVGRRLGDGLTGLLMLRSLRESEVKLEEAQRIAHVGYWDRDLDSNFVNWSNESLRIFGLPPENGGVAFPRYQELLHPDDRQRVVSAVAEALRGGARYDVEYRVVRPSGEVRIVHSQGDVVRDGAGRPRRMFGIVQDITERRHAEEALRDVQADLARVARLTTLGELAASLAHEINQPLAAIALNAASGMRWLNQDAPDLASARAALARIERDGVRASDVIRGLRALAQKSGLQLTRLDIRDAIEEVLVLTRGELQRHRVVLRTDLSAGAQPVLGDRVQLQQVLLNLIVNGIQAMAAVSDRGRELTVSLALAAPDRLQVTVEDTGPGLDPAIAQRIFDPFFTTKSDGLGMGLSICRSIVEAHGGQLGVFSHAPHGAAFHFTIPIAWRSSSAAA